MPTTILKAIKALNPRPLRLQSNAVRLRHDVQFEYCLHCFAFLAVAVGTFRSIVSLCNVNSKDKTFYYDEFIKRALYSSSNLKAS